MSNVGNGKLKLVVVPLTPDQAKAQETDAAQEGWFRRSLVAFDIFVNVVLLRGQEDETISSHSARAAMEDKRWGRVMCWFLNLFQSDHGPKAIAGDIQRAENIERIEKESGGIKLP